jgi:hypothetical protein
METIKKNTGILPLNDENLRLVNLYLLSRIREFKPKGMQGLFDNLDNSFKKEGLLKYDKMKAAIKRDLEVLQSLNDNPKELRKWLNSQKETEKLQIRIKGDIFLLNNILQSLGISFEDLFNKDNLPGIAEASIGDTEIDDADDKQNQIDEILQEMNTKLDTIIEKYTGDKTRIKYMRRFNDLIESTALISNMLIQSFDKPKEFGFSKKKDNDILYSTKTREIYGTGLFFIQTFSKKLRKNNKINILLNERFLNNNAIELPVKRILSPFFLMGILEQLLINFIISGIRNRKAIFYIIKGNISDYFQFFKDTFDTKELLIKVREANTKIISFISHVLRTGLKPDDDICIKCEILLVEFVNSISSLFQLLLPTFGDLNKIFKMSSDDKDMENNINKLFNPGMYYSFGIKYEQLAYFDTFMEKLEEMRIELDRYYIGNVDVITEPPRNAIGITSS